MTPMQPIRGTQGNRLQCCIRITNQLRTMKPTPIFVGTETDVIRHGMEVHNVFAKMIDTFTRATKQQLNDPAAALKPYVTNSMVAPTIVTFPVADEAF